jgi:hypothetical protein
MHGRSHDHRDDLQRTLHRRVGRASTPARHALAQIARSHRSRNSAEPESKTVLIANFAISTVVSVDAAEGPHRNLRP